MKVALVSAPLFLDQHVKGRMWKRVIPRIHPLGLGYVASYLLANGDEVEIIDAAAELLANRQIVARVRTFAPDLIGISTTTPSFVNVKQLCVDLKHALPDIGLVLGGAHVTAVEEEALLESVADYGVIGEGEEGLVSLVNHLKGGRTGASSLRGVKGLMFRSGGEVVKTERPDPIADVNGIPFPARHLMLPAKRLRPLPASYVHLPSLHLISSRGCPSLCTFCDRKVFGTRFRPVRPKRVVDEVEEIVSGFGARDVKFFDDTFTADRGRVYEICDELIRRRLNRVPWACLTKVRSVDRDLLRYMKRAGCWQVLFGLEHADPGMLRSLRKGNTVEDNRRAVLWAHEAGLNIRGDFIVGTPGETEESLRVLLDFALSLPLDYAHFNKFVPFPGTEIFQRLRSARGKNDFYDYNRSVSALTDMSSVEFVPEGLDPAVYRRFLVESHKRFYLRLPLLWRHLRNLRSVDQVRGQIDGGLAILGL